MSVLLLPATAQKFLNAHFKALTFAYAVEEQKFGRSEYEVTYTDRTEVDFRSDGEWESVERKYSALPAAIVPKEIAAFVAKNNFEGQYIKKIERNAYTWEIELSNGLEIKFDNQFNFWGYDD
ncbi:MAG: PepSY-like domain-containing protein [Alistipes sp.]|uniref:PepSY-like domain-containing protein n=1 Tax=Alistipes sp. TaxID=1872444 RepID=UPI0025B8B0FD|nr:PepSY-like domain-containing protein [Alistipes sp.]MCD8275074.1 PepSY-like domain-containing protein [Alistipes sp.]